VTLSRRRLLQTASTVGLAGAIGPGARHLPGWLDKPPSETVVRDFLEGRVVLYRELTLSVSERDWAALREGEFQDLPSLMLALA
jgi:hypothetical protein